MPGLLVLNGGDEFKPGNEPQDLELVAACAGRPAYVLATAAARQRPEVAVATAKAWFAGLGLEIEELPVLSRRQANDEKLAAQASGAGLIYLTGGDPGLVVKTLAGTRVWSAIVEAWAGGAALAGSSAGSMALCEWTLVIAKWPKHEIRKAVPGLGLVAGTAVLPHYDTFGHRWAEAGIVDPPSGLLLVGPDERTAAVWSPAAGWRPLGRGNVFGIEGLPAPDPENARRESA